MSTGWPDEDDGDPCRRLSGAVFRVWREFYAGRIDAETYTRLALQALELEQLPSEPGGDP